MKKKVPALACALLLCGCVNQAEVPKRVLSQLERQNKEQQEIGYNHTKELYTYYLPQGMGRKESTRLSEVFTKDGYKIVMNFDPGAIVIRKYYTETDTTETKSDTITSPSESKEIVNEKLTPKMKEEDNKIIYNGYYYSASKHMFPYTMKLIMNDGMALVYLDASIVELYAYVPIASIPTFAKSMMTIATSLSYDETTILKEFSLKSLQETKKQNLDYLEQHMPSSGSLEELLNPNEQNPPTGDMPQQEE